MFSSGQQDHRTNVTYLDLISHPMNNRIYLSVLFSSYSPCNCLFDIFTFFFSLKHILLPCFQLKGWLFWTEQERLIFPPIVPCHILSFCCTGQSRPAVAELRFLCFLWCMSYIVNLNTVKFSPYCSSLISSCLRYLSLITSCLEDSAIHFNLFFMLTTQEGREIQVCQYLL